MNTLYGWFGLSELLQEVKQLRTIEEEEKKRKQNKIPLQQEKMSRGSTWAEEEIRYLISIWSDENIKSQLENTHKNANMYKLFSERMKERGYERTAEQCHLKVKKLRQQYIKVRDAIRKSGASTNAKDTFAFYDEMDTILGTRPTSSPIKVLESSTSSNETASSGTENTSESGE